jgi:uncharacterized protein (UPF0335 family)
VASDVRAGDGGASDRGVSDGGTCDFRMRHSAVGQIFMTALQASTQKQLRQLIEQIERLEAEKKALAGDIRDKYAESKALGFDVKALRKIVSLRKMSRTDRQEEEAVLAVYMHALGMIDEIPELPGASADREKAA